MPLGADGYLFGIRARVDFNLAGHGNGSGGDVIDAVLNGGERVDAVGVKGRVEAAVFGRIDGVAGGQAMAVVRVKEHVPTVIDVIDIGGGGVTRDDRVHARFMVDGRGDRVT